MQPERMLTYSHALPLQMSQPCICIARTSRTDQSALGAWSHCVAAYVANFGHANVLYGMQDQQHWTDYLLRRLRGATKLVGPTISCQDPESGLNTTDGHAAVPYVQFLVMATDAVRCSS